jgi:hypothetical protein
MITSVILFFGVRNCADKRQADGVEGAHTFTFLNDFVEAIIMPNDAPIVHLTIFQGTLNDVRRIFVHRQLLRINVPKQIFGEFL